MTHPFSETADRYVGVVAAWYGWRVIVCKDGIQWIIQRKRGGQRAWRNESFCVTLRALIRNLTSADAPPDAIETLRTLPENAAQFDLGAWREAKADLAIT
ncbi:hypothetical protein [Thalassococcus lentus]|uniref:Transposase n=1 Tax=Thalassococcus lentus TaxID=1210524 RepID=A0ABT4XUD2_9RHOB|nr:hypothetical protein [Thalassococcus lentus]MDA7425572.1 hypothetical protein [Thalassococcus lentus]